MTISSKQAVTQHSLKNTSSTRQRLSHILGGTHCLVSPLFLGNSQRHQEIDLNDSAILSLSNDQNLSSQLLFKPLFGFPSFDSFFSDFAVPQFPFSPLHSVFSPTKLKYTSPGPDELNLPSVMGERLVEITTDQGYKTIRFNGGMGHQVLLLSGSPHPRVVKATGLMRSFVVNVGDSVADREIHLRHTMGSSTVRVDRSQHTRVLTVTTPLKRFTQQYRIPPNTSAYVCTQGPSEDYLIKISGTKKDATMEADAAKLPVAPYEVRLSEFHRENVFSKSGHDTELNEVDRNGKVMKKEIFKDANVKEYTATEFRKQFGNRYHVSHGDGKYNTIVNEKHMSHQSPGGNRVVTHQAYQVVQGRRTG